MASDPIAAFLIQHDINPEALVLAITASIVVFAWGWLCVAIYRGIVR